MVGNGDNNTNFFHKYVNYMRVHNSIWDIKDAQGEWVNNSRELDGVAKDYFEEVYKDSGSSDINSQMKILQYFPRLFSEEEGNQGGYAITLKEVEHVLKGFAKAKSPGPDGWPVEFFLEFFDILGLSLLNMVEESRTLGVVSGATNSTFIALIPKCNRPKYFKEYKPKTLCNLV